MKRKDFIKMTGTTSAFVALGGVSWLLESSNSNKLFQNMQPSASGSPVREGNFTNVLMPMQYFDLQKDAFTAQQATIEILKGKKSNVWGYHNGILGKPFQFNKGDNVDILFTNNISMPTNIHWHGSVIPSDMDGYPTFMIQPGSTFRYQFTINQRASMYWLHPHVHGITAKQVVDGLASLWIVRDDEEKALRLPSGIDEGFFVIQDKRIDFNGNILYAPDFAELMSGYFGSYILVNGVHSPSYSVRAGWNRVRVLNGSTARIYNIALSNKSPFYIIGADGGLLRSAEMANKIMLAPGERLDLLIDFTKEGGKEVFLQNDLFPGDPDQGKEAFRILKFKVESTPGYAYTIPSVLSTIMPMPASSASYTRMFDISNVAMDKLMKTYMSEAKSKKKSNMKGMNMGNNNGQMAGMNMGNDNGQMAGMNMGGASGMPQIQHTINGVSYSPDVINFTLPAGSTEIWEFDNSQGDEAHPMHYHGVQFQVLDRVGGRGVVEPQEKGFKDVVLCKGGEKVRVIANFSQYKGNYVVHCHNLEHEDSGMMQNFSLV